MHRLPVRLYVLAALAWGAGSGCPGTADQTAPTRPFTGAKIAVGAIDEPGLVAIARGLKGEWSESRGATLEVRDQPIGPPYATDSVDVLLFPGDRLGELVDLGALAVIPDSLVKAESMAFAEVLPAYRDQATKYGEDRMALPIGGSALVLVYRTDALERPDLVETAGAAGVRLAVPETWEDLDKLVQFFRKRDWNGDGRPDLGIACALGRDPEGVGNDLFLARSASLGAHPDHYSFLLDADTVTPRITGPPFVASLESLTKWVNPIRPASAPFDAEQARAAFREGRAALLIDRAENAAAWASSQTDGPARPVGVAPLPGSRRVYEPSRKVWIDDVDPPNRPSFLPRGGGWLVGVTTAAERAGRLPAALDFAAELAGTENAPRLFTQRDLPMLPVRSSLLGRGLPDPSRARGVDGRRWSDAVQKTLMASRVVIGPRIPGTAADLNDLDAARESAISGTPPQETLETAAHAWTERARQFGQDRLKWHYRRSLNNLSTAPAPPPGARTHAATSPERP